MPTQVNQYIPGSLRVAGWAGLSDGRRFLVDSDIPSVVGALDLVNSDGTPLVNSDGTPLQNSTGQGGFGQAGFLIEHVQTTPLQVWAIAWPYDDRPGPVEVWDSREVRAWPRIWWDQAAGLIFVRFSLPTTGSASLFRREDPGAALN